MGESLTAEIPVVPEVAPAPLAGGQPTWPVLNSQGWVVGYSTDPTISQPGYTYGPQITEPPPVPGAPRPQTTQFGGPLAAPTAAPPPPGGTSVEALPSAPVQPLEMPPGPYQLAGAPTAPAATPRPAIEVGTPPKADDFDPWGDAGLDKKPTTTAPTEAFDPWGDAGLPNTPATHTPQPPKADGTSPHSDEHWYQHLGTKVLGTVRGMATGQGVHTASHELTMGYDDIVGPLIPAIVDALASGGGAKSFAQHYEANRKAWEEARLQYAKDNPAAAAIMSGAGMVGSLAIPMGGAVRAGSFGRRLLKGAATGVGIGGVGGFGMGEGSVLDPKALEERAKGAAVGGLLGGVLSPVAQVAGPVVRGIRGVITPSSRVPGVVGNILNEAEAKGMSHGAGPWRPRTSPVPDVEYNLAEATRSMELAALQQDRWAANVPARHRHETAQQEAIFKSVPAVQTGDQLSIAVERSKAAEAAIRESAKLARSEEKRLWQSPALSKPSITTSTTKEALGDLAANIRLNEPGLFTDALNATNIQSVLNAAQALPGKAAANQINGIASQFGKIARDFNQPDHVRAVAKRLEREARGALMNSPEVVGRPPVTIPKGWRHNPDTGNTEWHPGGVEPAIAPDPVLVRDIRKASDFTGRKADVFGHANFDAIWKKNSYGNETLTEGEGLAKFFNFKNGTMKQGQIKDVGKFMDDIATEWRGLGRKGFDPTEVAQVRGELVKNTKEFITASMLHNVESVNTLEAGQQGLQLGQQMLQLGKLRTAIAHNRNMLVDSGMYTPQQIDMWDRIAHTSQVIHNAAQKGAPIGSPTYTRLAGDSRFIDLFVGGAGGRVALTGVLSTVAGVLAGYLSGHNMLLSGTAASVASMAVHSGIEGFFHKPRGEVMALLDEALNNPVIARELMQAAHKGAKFSEKTRDWLMRALGVTSAQLGNAYADKTLEMVQ